MLGGFTLDNLILFGNGSVASVAYWMLEHDSPYQVAAFTVDREYLQEDTLFGLPVVPFKEVQSLYPPAEYQMLIAVGYAGVNKLRTTKYCQAKQMGYKLASHISSKATTWPGLNFGENCMIGANCVIQPFVEIGNNIIIRDGTFVGHHTVIRDHCFLAPGVVVAGKVIIEPYCFLGVNATIRDGITLSQACVIGAGANILESTQERGVYLGKPADLLPMQSNEIRIA
jgi:sugar O-acyltransferase (sialic acid O-acetyltransferase NeuD family)